MRSELNDYYKLHRYKKCMLVRGVNLIKKSILRYYFSKIDLGSEKWLIAQHNISSRSSSYFDSEIRTLFYEITMGEHCKGKFYCLPYTCLNFPERIQIGYNVFINRNVNIVARDNIYIGDNVIIGPNTIINSGSHNYYNRNDLIRNQGHKKGKIIIEDDVFIGGNVFVLPGVTIGHGSVVGAGAVVTKSVEPYTVVVGVPAVQIKKR